MFGSVSIGFVATAAALWCAATFFWAAMLVASFKSSLPLRHKAAWIAAITFTHAIGAFVFYFQHVRETAELPVEYAPARQPEPVPFLRAA